MKNKRNIMLSLMLAGIVLGGCQKSDPVNYTPAIDFQNNKKAADLIDADNAFALDLFGEVYAENEEENFMISPLSVSIALGMTYNGADGETKTAFEEALRMGGLDRHDINFIHGALINHLLKVDPLVTMEIANSIWVNQLYTLMDEFRDTCVFYYDAEINSLDFFAPASVGVINDWVSVKTHQKIPEVLEEISPDAVMYLINALYFNGTWKYSFDKEHPAAILFTDAEGNQEELAGMALEGDLWYGANDMVKVLDLPYGNDKYVMTLLVPTEGYSSDDIVAAMSRETWSEWLDGMTEQNVHLTMPKFKFEYKTLLNNALAKMGMGIAFTGGAEFPLMVEEADNLFISKVIHKTYVDVNEEGTEAAAVTVVAVELTSIGDDYPVNVYVDKPFLFVIREKTSNAIVFLGKTGKPLYE